MVKRKPQSTIRITAQDESNNKLAFTPGFIYEIIPAKIQSVSGGFRKDAVEIFVFLRRIA
jgi:hypothetical protein